MYIEFIISSRTLYILHSENEKIKKQKQNLRFNIERKSFEF